MLPLWFTHSFSLNYAFRDYNRYESIRGNYIELGNFLVFEASI